MFTTKLLECALPCTLCYAWIKSTTLYYRKSRSMLFFPPQGCCMRGEGKMHADKRNRHRHNTFILKALQQPRGQGHSSCLYSDSCRGSQRRGADQTVQWCDETPQLIQQLHIKAVLTLAHVTIQFSSHELGTGGFLFTATLCPDMFTGLPSQ